MKRFDPSTGSSLLTLGVIAAVGLLLSVLTVVPNGTRVAADGRDGSDDLVTANVDELEDASATEETGVQGGATADGTSSGGAGATRTGGGGPAAGTRSGGSAAQGAGCEGNKNAGNTDVGVTGTTIKLAATVVDDGPGASFLGPVRIGMKAVLNKVNRAGGICGRKLDLILRNDSWSADRGNTFIQNFVEGEKVFALAVVPSSEGLRAAKTYIRDKKVPVVGTDGMLIHQYRNPWIWPVATSTISTMHIMAKNAHERGSQHFGIVYDSNYHFGVEGAYAYNEAVKRLTGRGVDGYSAEGGCRQRFCGIQPGKASYATEANTFNSDCYSNQAKPRCDFVAFLLEPQTAVSFMSATRPANPVVGMGGAQPLFTRGLAENCKAQCDGMWVWTGYNPPIEALASQPAVAQFVNDIRQESATADIANQFLEGGYVGMSLLVEALKRTGSNLTRDSLRQTLDNMTFDSGLSSPLTWRPDNHFANVSAQAFEIQYKQSFSGWRQKTGFVKDPWVGQDIPEGE